MIFLCPHLTRLALGNRKGLCRHGDNEQQTQQEDILVQTATYGPTQSDLPARFLATAAFTWLAEFPFLPPISWLNFGLLLNQHVGREGPRPWISGRYIDSHARFRETILDKEYLVERKPQGNPRCELPKDLSFGKVMQYGFT
jgi:hypothetical protein